MSRSQDRPSSQRSVVDKAPFEVDEEDHVPYTPAKAAYNRPIVTIIGAGIAGLSAAQELAERGFLVQVVEREADPDHPGEVKVGGLAASQYGRAKASWHELQLLHLERIRDELARLHGLLAALNAKKGKATGQWPALSSWYTQRGFMDPKTLAAQGRLWRAHQAIRAVEAEENREDTGLDGYAGTINVVRERDELEALNASVAIADEYNLSFNAMVNELTRSVGRGGGTPSEAFTESVRPVANSKTLYAFLAKAVQARIDALNVQNVGKNQLDNLARPLDRVYGPWVMTEQPLDEALGFQMFFAAVGEGFSCGRPLECVAPWGRPAFVQDLPHLYSLDMASSRFRTVYGRNQHPTHDARVSTAPYSATARSLAEKVVRAIHDGVVRRRKRLAFNLTGDKEAKALRIDPSAAPPGAGPVNSTHFTALMANLTDADWEDDLVRYVGPLMWPKGNAGIAAAIRRQVLYIECQGHTDSSCPADRQYPVSMSRAQWLYDLLLEAAARLKMTWVVEGYVHRAAYGEAQPAVASVDAATRAQNRRAQLAVIERRMPGEHGFRFFPRHYWNITDTMSRIPLLDDQGRETRATAADNLISTVRQALGHPTGHIPLLRVRPNTLNEFLKGTDDFLDGLTDSHAERGELLRGSMLFQLQVFRFLSSSPLRRWKGYGDLSWVEFIGMRPENGPAAPPNTALGPTRTAWLDYPAPLRKQVEAAAQALLAYSGGDADAHSYGNFSGQTIADQMTREPPNDRLLNGPTTQSWLRPWKRWLETLGVRFFRGQLTRLELKKVPVDLGRERVRTLFESTLNPEVAVVADADRLDDEHAIVGARDLWELVPTFDPEPEPDMVAPRHAYLGADPNKPGASPDFYILAIPLTQAADVVKDIRGRDGQPWNQAGLWTVDGAPVLTLGNGPWKLPQGPDDHTRDLVQLMRFWDAVDREDALKHMTGLQFYYGMNLGLSFAHVYYPESAWGLSAVSQTQFWRNRPQDGDGYLGVLSLDICDWKTPFTLWDATVDYARLEEGAQDCSGQQVALGVWSQIEAVGPLRGAGGAVHNQHPPHDPPWNPPSLTLPPPAVYHLDWGRWGPDPFGAAVPPDQDPLPTDPVPSNRYPYLANFQSQFPLRPGLVDPARGPALTSKATTLTPDERRALREALWQAGLKERDLDDLADDALVLLRDQMKEQRAPQIEYAVAFKRWVLAGAHMASYTRMMTMEGSCESGRWAANAVLRTLRDNGPGPMDHNGPIRYVDGVPVPWQDAAIWNLEDEEIPDLRPLRRIDETLALMGLPHLFDLLKIEDALVVFLEAVEVLERMARLTGQPLPLDRVVQLELQLAARVVTNLKGLPHGSVAEAVYTDPQVRLALEVTWKALGLTTMPAWPPV